MRISCGLYLRVATENSKKQHSLENDHFKWSQTLSYLPACPSPIVFQVTFADLNDLMGFPTQRFLLSNPLPFLAALAYRRLLSLNWVRAVWAKVSCKAIDCIRHPPFPYETDRSGMASPVAQLRQPCLRMHSPGAHQNKAVLMKEATPLPWPPRDWKEMFRGASGWQVPLVFLFLKGC